MKEINDERIDTLFKAVLELKTVDECRRFFTDLCTISELKLSLIHISEPTRQAEISYAVFCLKKKKKKRENKKK